MNKPVIIDYNNYLTKDERADLENVFKNSFEIIIKTLNLEDNFPEIKYFLYPSVEVKEKETGEDANAHTDRDKFEVYLVYNDTIKPTGPHELVHLLTSHIGVPNYVFCEGLAEYFEEFWKAKVDGKLEALEHNVWVKKFLSDNTYISISELFDDSKFWDLDDDAVFSYPECGSFIKHLVGKYGMDKVMQAYSKLTRNNPNSSYNYKVFNDIFGITVQESEREWLASLS